MMEVYTGQKTKLMLEDQPLGNGGEGTVYRIKGYPKKVAKIYHSTEDAALRREKIIVMTNIADSDGFIGNGLRSCLAWPLAPLFNRSGEFIGFGMDSVDGSLDLSDLYHYIPENTKGFSVSNKLVFLISMCDTVDRLHRINQVFGDFNPTNIKIRPDGTVCFIDADSFHIRSNGILYRCTVCAAEYTAPELIRACRGTTFADCSCVTFTRESDYFALAIHIFRTLMNGTHPYFCRSLPNKDGVLQAAKPLNQRIESGLTPFFTSVPGFGIPFSAPAASSLPDYITDLFKLAFIDGTTDPGVRPSADEWKRALLRYKAELAPCPNNTRHQYHKKLRSCPYCAADRLYMKNDPLIRCKPQNEPPPPQKPKCKKTKAATTAAAGIATAGIAGGTVILSKSVGSGRTGGILDFFSCKAMLWIVTVYLALTLCCCIAPPMYDLALQLCGNEAIASGCVILYVLIALAAVLCEDRQAVKSGCSGKCLWRLYSSVLIIVGQYFFILISSLGAAYSYWPIFFRYLCLFIFASVVNSFIRIDSPLRGKSHEH